MGNYVWEDKNGNGVQDDNEPAIAQAIVTLLDAMGNQAKDINGANIPASSTDANGLYSFTNLKPGTPYVVQFTKPLGSTFVLTSVDKGGDDSKDSDASLVDGKAPAVTLTSGENNPTIDAGFNKPASIGDFVWYDKTANGIQDGGETGIPNATVTLTGTKGDGTAIVPIVVQTGSMGEYLFANLAPGTYTVTFTKPSGYVGASPTGAGTNATDSDANPNTGTSSPITLVSGDAITTVDAGFYKPASLGDYVWEDKNANGIQEATEPAIIGAIVSLLDASGNQAKDIDGNPIEPKNTDMAGNYSFNNLKPGEIYVVKFEAPAGSGFVPTLANTSDDAKDSDAVGGKSQEIILLSEQNDPTIDAGFYKPAKLGDFVWEDKNANGIQDNNEPGIDGATVTLFGTAGDGTPVSLSTSTTNGGAYLFNNLKPGTYTVVFSRPSGFNETSPQGAGTTATDSDANPSNGFVAPVTLVSGDDNRTIDAGYYNTASLGNYVWEDTNANGIQENTEPGILNVTVGLVDASGNPAKDNDGNTVPNQNTIVGGAYNFTNLKPGIEYFVVFSTPSGFVPTTPNIVGDDAKDSDAVSGKSQGVTLSSGENNETIDAGFYKLATLGNYAWYDANRNGKQDSFEFPAKEVLVELFKSNGTLVGSKTTDLNGFYLFNNLIPGDYYIRGTHPDGFFRPTTANLGGNDEVDSDISSDPSLRTSVVTSLESGENDLTWDMGFFRGAEFNITDPCLCRNDATNLINGRYNEEVTVKGTPGEIWTVKTQNGILLSNSAAPPAAGTPMQIGTPMIETPIGSGVFILNFQHVDAIGYAITVTNETTPGLDPLAVFNGNQSNTCLYPEPNYTKITNSACSNAGPIELLAQPNMPGTIKYTLSNVNTQELITIMPDMNGKFFINPANIPIAKYDMVIEFTPTDPAKCKQLQVLSAEFEVKTCTALPVNLVSFNANNINNQIGLDWKTSAEKNFSHFEVQKSVNLTEFGSIGQVNQNLNSIYRFVDQNPSIGINYYKLKMVDNDGTFEFSKIVSVEYNKGEKFVIAENPAINGRFNVITNLPNPQFYLYNGIAKSMNFTMNSDSDNKFNLSVTNYTSGTYYLTIISEGKTITKKIIIP